MNSEQPGVATPPSPPTRVGFLLLPQLAMLPFTAAIDPLRIANRLSGRTLYQWRLYATGREPVLASTGIGLLPDAELGESDWPQRLFVVGGLEVWRHDDAYLLRWLRRQAARGVELGGICTGSALLAAAGLLDGYRCTIHWENLAAFAERYPALRITDHVYEIDRDRYTCSGGTAALDLMLQLIARDHDTDLALAVAEQYLHDRLRTPGEHQRMAGQLALLRQSPRLAAAVNLMAIHIETPLSTSELAARSGLSLRQLERVFRQHQRCTPQQYYLRLRLRRARQLLTQTECPVMQVALATGFASHSHFSKCYRELFGRTPQQERRAPFLLADKDAGTR
ncbi:MAG: GlxA family transcriptional regulator [Candidatus Competibacterales bacterium]|nr:GlxA family transcriptional regulator [Candidatus Competibacterales bacterium]